VYIYRHTTRNEITTVLFITAFEERQKEKKKGTKKNGKLQRRKKKKKTNRKRQTSVARWSEATVSVPGMELNSHTGQSGTADES